MKLLMGSLYVGSVRGRKVIRLMSFQHIYSKLHALNSDEWWAYLKESREFLETRATREFNWSWGPVDA